MLLAHIDCICYYCSVATPLAAKKNVKGSDTGFWKELEKKLFELSVLNGTDHMSALWVWYVHGCGWHKLLLILCYVQVGGQKNPV